MNTLRILLIGLFLIAKSSADYCDKNLIDDLTFKFNGRNIAFNCPSTKNIYISTSRFIPSNIIGTRLQIHKDIAYVTIPRYRPGVPFTVAKFNLSSNNCKVSLEPFPCWSIHEEGNCDAIQNAIDLFIDPFDRLWVLDLGICNTFEQPVKRCQPKLWGISLESGEVVKTVSLEPFVANGSSLQFVVVDFSTSGVPFAFVSDAGTGAIIVVNLQLGSGFRVVLPREVGVGCVAKDILFIQLIRKPTGNTIYFNYLSSPRLFSIESEQLQTGQTANAIVTVGEKPSGPHMVFLGTDDGSGIFFRFKGERGDIYIWDTDMPFRQENFMFLQKGGDCRVATEVVPGWKNLMWVLDSNYHCYITNTAGCLGASMAVYPLVKTCG